MSGLSHTHPVPTTGMRGGLGRILLTAFLLLAIGPLSVVGYVAFNQVRNDRQRATIERLTTAANLREAQLREWVRMAILVENPAAPGEIPRGDKLLEQNMSGHLKALLESDQFEATALPPVAFGLGRTGVVYLMNRDGRSWVLQGTLLSRPLPKSQGVMRALSGQSGAASYENEAGIPVIGAYRWLDDVELALIAEQDQAEAFAASDELAAGLIGAMLGVALLTAIIAAAVTRQITRPIVLLTEAAVRMSGGDLTVRVRPMRRDEIGILANVFNTMASELHDLYVGLEHKVAERTRQVQKAKEQIQYHAWQLSISAEVGRITTSILDLNTLLARASELIRDAFQLDQVGVYLLDAAGKVVVLQSNVGRAVPEHERQLHVEDTHRISLTISQRMPRMITWPNCDGRSDICCELVLPLALGSRAIGALDLTSRDPGGFSESDQGVLQTLADQLSVAIENARTYSEEHEAADEMREIDRLRGQFLMRMSHQLATYLNTIIGFPQLMLKGLDGPLTELQARDLTAIRHSGQQLGRLLDDTLELASLEVGAVELDCKPVDLSNLADELRTTLASALVNPQLRLQVQAEPNLPVVMADAVRLRQVLTNLVITAAEMSREGVIILRLAQVDSLVEFNVSAPTMGEHVESNQGISLALSRHLVELHGGRLRVEQREGATVFSFALPLNVRWTVGPK